MKSYWELDYRKKFIRTIWMIIPVTILVIIPLLIIITPLTIAAAVFLFFIFIAQLIYNYTKWKVKFKPHWQERVDLIASKIRIVPEKRAFFLGIISILITYLLSLLMSDLFAISNWVMMLLEGIAYFFVFLYVFGVFDKRHKRSDK